jgi:monoamine oxidase
MPKASKQIIVAGAGIAGLTAARELAEEGSDVLLLEASHRIGGRLHSLHVKGIDAPIELGAEFVHGCPTDLLDLIAEAGLDLEGVEGESYCFNEGKLQPCAKNGAFDILDALERYEGPDLSFAEYLRRHPVDPASAKQAIAYVEGFNAADAEKISIHALAMQQRAEEAIEGDRAFRLKQGYTALVDYLHTQFSQAGGRTLLQTQLEQLAWRSRCVQATVRNADGSTQELIANQAVIALPLGVLQAGSVKFLPYPEVLEATKTLSMGPVRRLVLVFKQRFWASKDYGLADMSFLFSGTLPSVWWTRSPSDAPILTAWIGGSRTREVNPDDLVSKALECLSQTFGISGDWIHALLSSSHCHDWNLDPLALGAYSYALMDGIAGSVSLSQPIDSTLFIAGEHTDITGHWGTVHGALRSGKRAAQQILESSLDIL